MTLLTLLTLLALLGALSLFGFLALPGLFQLLPLLCLFGLALPFIGQPGLVLLAELALAVAVECHHRRWILKHRVQRRRVIASEPTAVEYNHCLVRPDFVRSRWPKEESRRRKMYGLEGAEKYDK